MDSKLRVRIPYFTTISSLVFLFVLVSAVLELRGRRKVSVLELARSKSLVVKEKFGDIQERLLATLEVQRRYGELYGDLTEVRRALQGITLVKQGIDPLSKLRGKILRGFRSRIDDTLQTYWTYVPEDYDPDKPTPLLVSLHGHGWYDWWRPYQGSWLPELSGVITVSPQGRGSMDYMFLGEADVLECLEDIKRFYNIDENRTYCMGFSMGGTGTWHLATHYPDLFAGIAPAAGNTDFRVWAKKWGWTLMSQSPIRWIREFARAQTSPITFAENLFNVPVLTEHRSEDIVVPVDHTRNMVNRLRAIRHNNIEYIEGPGGHSGFGTGTDPYKWLLSKRRNPYPNRVLLKTDRLRYDKAYWLRIDGIEKPLAYALVDARKTATNKFSISTRNLTSLTLLFKEPFVRPGSVRVNIDGVRITAEWNGGELSFVKQNSVWFEGRESGLRKKKGLEGPIEDAFLSRFLVVYGTTSPSPLERWAVRHEALDLNQQWQKRFLGPLRLKADSELTPEDIQDSNLILYGGPHANSITAQVMLKLPIRMQGKKVCLGNRLFEGDDVGLKMCYPNPLNPEKYVVIFAGTTWKSIYQINGRFGNWFDWIPYYNRNWMDFAIFDDRTTIPETFLAFGFFNHLWEFDERFIWYGYEKYRSRVKKRVVPLYTCVPDVERLYLSDLLPLDIDFIKGTVGFDRSFEGNPIRIGNKLYEKGLGTRVDSALLYDIGGIFSSFEVEVGIDLEGKAEPSEARKSTERVDFKVYGDGILLGSATGLRWSDPPRKLTVNVRGVHRLKLVTEAWTGDRWLYGSAAWGNPILRK